MSIALVDTGPVRAACERILEAFAAKQTEMREHLMAAKRQSLACRRFKATPALSMSEHMAVASIGSLEIGTAKELIDLCDVADAYGDPRIALSSKHAAILRPFLHRGDRAASGGCTP